MTLEEQAAHSRELSDIELERVLATKISTSHAAIAARAEIARRERKRTFWRKDIVAWIALVVTVVSIVIGFLLRKP